MQTTTYFLTPVLVIGVVIDPKKAFTMNILL